MNFDSSLLNLTFTNNSGSNLYVQKTSDKNKHLGLITDTIYETANGDSLITDKTGFSGTNKIIIETDVLIDSYNSSNQNKRVLDIIYVDDGFDNKIHYTNQNPILTNTTDLNNINIILRDEFGDFLQTSNDYDLKLFFKK